MMIKPIDYKQAALNMKYLVGENLQEIISDRSTTLRHKVDQYIDTYLSMGSASGSTVTFETYKQVFNSVFLHYVSEFVRGELDDETNVILHFDEAISSYVKRDHLDTILATTNANQDNVDPAWYAVMQDYSAMVDEIADNSIFQDNTISFSYATYATLANMRDIFIYLADPETKIRSCFRRSELFIDTIASECKKNIEQLQSLHYQTAIEDAEAVEELEELESL